MSQEEAPVLLTSSDQDYEQQLMNACHQAFEIYERAMDEVRAAGDNAQIVIRLYGEVEEEQEGNE